MGFHFFKSIKLNDLLNLNLSTKGIGFSTGVKGAHVSTNSHGTYLTLSLPGTGISYRQKLTDAGVGVSFNNVINKLTKNNSTSAVKKKDDNKVQQKTSNKEEKTQINTQDQEIVDQYNKLICITSHLYRYSENVKNANQFDKVSDKYELLISGNEEEIEKAAQQFDADWQYAYQKNIDADLIGHDLYADIDLPEIEMLENQYPIIEDNKLVYKDKSLNQLKKQYYDNVLALAIFVSANLFNLTPYIENVILSGYTQKRNHDGDLVDEYLYSIKFTREKMQEIDLEKIEDPYQFILQFENRINVTNYNFKAIKPYTNNPNTDNKELSDALTGLINLGYKASEINSIKPKLLQLSKLSTDQYLKEALKLLAK